MIAGSTGAPLYKTSDCQPEAICVSAYHYMWLILYPNQTYSFKPVHATNGTLTVNILNGTAYIVANDKLDVYGNPVEIPVRVKYTVGGTDVYIVAMIPANTTIVFNINPAENYRVETNATDFYVYFTRGDDYNATVILPENDLSLANYNVTGEIILYESVTLTSPTPTTTTTTTTTKPVTTTTSTTITTTTTTTTTTETTTEPLTTTLSTTTAATTTTTTSTIATTTTLLTTTQTTTSTTTSQDTSTLSPTLQDSTGGDRLQIAIVIGIVLVGVGIGIFTILKKR